MTTLERTKKRIISEWLPADEKERLKIANDICNDLAWELNISKIPYNPLGRDAPEDEWQWATKSKAESIEKETAKNARHAAND